MKEAGIGAGEEKKEEEKKEEDKKEEEKKDDKPGDGKWLFGTIEPWIDDLL